MPYIAEDRDRSPLNVVLDQQCHCLDGGLFAALSLWRIGFSPLLIDLVPEPGLDDDHVLAIFKADGRWGAVAKSNYVNLGYRDPIYKTLRELVLTYFEHYFNNERIKTLRGYTRPLNLENYSNLKWAVNEIDTNKFYYSYFYGRKFIPIIDDVNPKNINLISDRSYQAETLFTDLNWSFGIRSEH
ncbi:MAG: hypothetical protein WCP19_06030 [Chloroflexota bacterium]